MLEVIVASLIVTAIVFILALAIFDPVEKPQVGISIVVVTFILSACYFTNTVRELNKEIESAKLVISNSPYQGETSYYSFGLSKDNQLTAVSKTEEYKKPLQINCDLEDHSLCNEAEGVKFVTDFSNGLKKAMKEGGMQKDIKIYVNKP